MQPRSLLDGSVFDQEPPGSLNSSMGSSRLFLGPTRAEKSVLAKSLISYKYLPVVASCATRPHLLLSLPRNWNHDTCRDGKDHHHLHTEQQAAEKKYTDELI